MTSDMIVSIAGILVALVFTYIPGAKAWLDGQTPEFKRLFMLGVMFLVAGGALLLACTGFASDFGLLLTCDRAGIVGLVKAFVIAFGANQATYQVTKLTGKN